MKKIDSKWEETEPLSTDTGQGYLIKVRPSKMNNLNNVDNRKIYVYKKLKQQKDEKRRARMFREVSCLKSLIHPNIISVVDTNVEKYEDLNSDLFFVTPYIEGQNLDEFVKSDKDLSLDLIINSFVKLIDTVAYCHEENIIHRDIKPDNIMCANNNINDLILIDFGLSFNQDDKNITPTSEHIGNRFLYLPELQNGTKTDKRSDIAQLCGILFFMLTKRYPTNLQNEKNEMPHQRKEARNYLDKIFEKHQLDKIYRIFDQAFQININERYQSIESLKLDINKIMNKNKNYTITMDFIKEKLNNKNYKIQSNIMNHLINIDKFVSKTISAIRYELGDSQIISFYQTNHNTNFNLLTINNTIGIQNNFTNEKIPIMYQIQYIGNEITLQLIENDQIENILRCTLEHYGDKKDYITNNIKFFYLQRIEKIIT